MKQSDQTQRRRSQVGRTRGNRALVRRIETVPLFRHGQKLVRIHQRFVGPVLTVSNGVVSVSMPSPEDVSVLAFSPATDGTHPILIDQQLVDARQPTDHGIFRWTRIAGMLAAEPPEPHRGHIENLIEGSREVPEAVEKRI